MKTKEWYALLRKPSFAPPSWIFGPVWTVLYLGIAVSFGYAAYAWYGHELPTAIFALFVCNLITNFAYSPLQFGLRNLVLASVDVVLVLASLALALFFVYAYYPWIMWVNIPYLLWVPFATILQLTITGMNRDKWRFSSKNP